MILKNGRLRKFTRCKSVLMGWIDTRALTVDRSTVYSIGTRNTVSSTCLRLTLNPANISLCCDRKSPRTPCSPSRSPSCICFARAFNAPDTA